MSDRQEIRQVTNKHFVAALTDEEYLALRVDVAMKGLKLKDWIAQAIREKIKEEIDEG